MKKLNLMKDIQNSFDFFVKFWPHDLPRGFIHGDLFPDNVFFINDKITGVIDFYFSCTDILTYDLAIAINAWCFDKKNNFQDKKYQALLKGYNSKRKLSKDVNYNQMTSILSMFENIGPSHMEAEKLGYGGSCFPKDVEAFKNYTSSEILETIMKVNNTLLKIR